MKIENKKITFHLSEPFYKMSYQKFQEIRSNSSFEGEFIDDLNISFLNLSDTLKIEFLKLFKNSQRIPKEILTSFDINKILQDFEN